MSQLGGGDGRMKLR